MLLLDKDYYRLLVVDDSKMMRAAYKKVLGLKHFDLTYAECGETCLELIKTEKAFDLIILDNTMPGISGLEVLKRLREKFTLTELPIVMLTSNDDIKTIETAFETGANDYVKKPFNDRELIHRIELQLTLSDYIERAKNYERIEIATALVTTYNHEINNPLMIAMNSLRLIKVAEDDENSLAKKKILNGSLLRMKDIIIKISEATNKDLTAYVGDSKMLDLCPSEEQE